ncbi:NAD(P)-dependent oxidoreductase [Desulfosarcina alkanivorans]|uniref:NAD(P)-dependent oxidoreductase n=1 Tax=Desulfosarcina alkanivorans TaxID=571177 RepID=A0A5K7YMP6_9BACT|nr:NAD(P)-dependent oxidoreductase [Desulfosarcina alkanivorans]BBO70476.1 NAD(P)-dependent oxidoreductase [Desulfosarcina alkanivorans]
MASATDAGRLLITGASGFLGWHLCRQARAGWAVYALWRHHPVTVPGVITVQGDLTNAGFMESLLREIRPQAVIHAAAQSSNGFCESHAHDSLQINVLATERLAGLCRRLTIPFVFTSTDMVFDGTRPPYAENDPAAPLSAYGRQKADAEQRVLHGHPRALICRLPLLIGLSGGHGSTFSLKIIEALDGGAPVSLFADEFRTPVDGESAAAGILMALGRGTGVLHLGGRTRISRLQMGRRLAAIMGAGEDGIRPASLDDTAAGTRRPPDVALDSRRAYARGYDPLDLDRALARLVRLHREGCS